MPVVDTISMIREPTPTPDPMQKFTQAEIVPKKAPVKEYEVAKEQLGSMLDVSSDLDVVHA